MIKLRNVVKVFRAGEIETVALNNITLDIPERDFVAIMGPSGSGKSTLVNVLGLLDTVTSGEYIFNDVDVAGKSEGQMAKWRSGRIGVIFQSFHLIEELTVAQNVELPLGYLGVPRSERKAAVERVLERVGMSHRANHYPKQLSGGQKQRVAIARAVVPQPRLLLADEPTGNLDSGTGREIMELLRELNESGCTIVMVTHSHDDAKYAKRVLTMRDGMLCGQTTDVGRPGTQSL
ncbi:MAG: ABC transporter ATP-binding protein [Gammaproteobacteria bacterium]|nr:MAG: ABC transporter ATP-binding protein [Gammaproteobacteria bacterium]